MIQKKLLIFLLLCSPFGAFTQINESQFSCIDSLVPVGNVQIFGYLLHSYECDFTNMKIDGKWVDYEEGTLSLMKKLVKKKNLSGLLFLLSEVYLDKEDVLLATEDPIEISKHSFSEPLIEQSDAGYKVRVWLKTSTGKATPDLYKFVIFIVSKKGEIKRTDLSSFSWNKSDKKIVAE
jgi:hypothetical protein